MTECTRAAQAFPQRVPLKIIGRSAEMDPVEMARLIQEHLGPQPEGDREPTAQNKGAYISYTFWVILPRDGAEGPLRAALQRLPGVVMQL